jgi:predicted amidohydrolase YtcJ
MRRGWSVLLAQALVLSACGAPQQTKAEETADIVLVNGTIFTGDSTRPRVQALAISGDRIYSIGTSAEIGRIKAARRIDLGGRLVIPGINDAQAREPSLMGKAVRIDGGFETLTVRNLVASIQAATHEHPAGTWLRAELSRAALDDPTLTREMLDRVAPAHPVWVDNFAGHALVVNSAALRALALEPKAPPPRGGFVGRDGRSGADGWRFEYARFAAVRAFGRTVSDQEVVEAVRAFEAEAVELGITSVQTYPMAIDPARLVELLKASPRTLRWHVVRLPIGEIIKPPYSLALVGHEGGTAPDRDGMVSFYGTKYFLDGTPVERGAAMRTPYSDQNTTGRITWDKGAVREMLVNAHATGDPLRVHIGGDLQIQRLLDQMEQLTGVIPSKPAEGDDAKAGDWPAHRVVIDHGDGITKNDFARLHALGIVVVQNPSHTVTVELNRRRLGPRADSWLPLRSLLESKIPLALGSDGQLNPYLNIRFATEHLTNPGEALNVEEAITAYTHGSAYAEHTEHIKGRLVTGALADLAVLSQDVFTVSIDALPRTRSLLTIVGGRVVYDKLSRASGPSSARKE